jgi:hypothetical protein
MSSKQLTPTQHAILAHAIDEHDGRIDWFPENVNGGARVKVLAGLANRRLAIHQDGAWRVTPAAYAALGRAEPGAASLPPTPRRRVTWAQRTPPPRPRGGCARTPTRRP